MTKPNGGLSLADLDARSASERPYEFEYIDPDGQATGVYFQVLGAQSPKVVAETQRLLNDRRRKEAAASVRARTGGRQQEVTFTPVEEDIEFAQRLQAIRLVGWRGITDEFSADAAYRLICANRHVADQVAEASDNLANFMGTSSRA